MSKKFSETTSDDAAVAERISSLTDFCVKTLFLGLVPKTFVQTIFVLILFFLGFSCGRIAVLTGFCEKTVRKKINLFSHKGYEAVFARKKGVGRKLKTKSILEKIEEMLDSHDFRCMKQIQQKLSSVFNVSLCLSSVRYLLKSLGYNVLRAGSLPAKADPVAQRKFYDEILSPAMQDAKEGKSVLLFMDAAHPIFGCDYLGSIWTKVRRFIKTFSGRKRYNILGCINFITKEMITVTSIDYITATQVVELLTKLREIYVNIPIKIILDNARYQHCQLVMDLAKKLDIELCFLPPYSPNLNLIERVWKYLKKELSIMKFEKFDDFKKIIDNILSETHTTRKGEMDTLIGEKVQLFDNLVEKSSISFEVQKSEASVA